MAHGLSIAAVAVLLLGAAPQDIPRLSGPVTDAAGVLTPQQISNAAQASLALQASDSTQVVLLIIPSTNGREIADYALNVGRENGIGQKGKNNGVVIVVAVKDRKCRIEVGTGLEGKLTDALSAQIIRNEMVPYFQKGDMGTGAIQGMFAVISAVKGEYKGTGAVPGPRKKKEFSWLMIIVIIIFMLIPRRGRGGFFFIGGLGGGHGGSSGGGGGWSGGGGSFGGGGASGSW